jgi:hypothetical protein
MAKASGTTQDQRVGRGAALASRHVFRRSVLSALAPKLTA